MIIDIVLQAIPDTPNYGFVEIESPPGTSIHLGEWIQREDGFAAIRFDTNNGKTLYEKQRHPGVRMCGHNYDYIEVL